MLHQHCLKQNGIELIKSTGHTTDKSLSPLLNTHILSNLWKKKHPDDDNLVENCLKLVNCAFHLGTFGPVFTNPGQYLILAPNLGDFLPVPDTWTHLHAHGSGLLCDRACWVNMIVLLRRWSGKGHSPMRQRLWVNMIALLGRKSWKGCSLVTLGNTWLCTFIVQVSWETGLWVNIIVLMNNT